MQNLVDKIPTLLEDGASSATASSPGFADLYEDCKQSVVRVVGKTFFSKNDQPMVTERNGSGAVISANGAIITDWHVVKGASEIDIETASGEHLIAKVIKKDPLRDLAELLIQTKTHRTFPFLKLAAPGRHESAAFALGLPAGEKNCYVSPTAFLEESSYRSLAITRDVDVPPGNQDMDRPIMLLKGRTLSAESGAPVLNRRGQVLGLVDATDSTSTIVATPIEAIRTFLKRDL